eukprot:348245_1
MESLLNVLQSIGFLCWAICFVLLLATIYYVFCSEEGEEISIPSLKYLSTLSLIFFNLCLAAQVTFTSELDNNLHLDTDKHDWYNRMVVAINIMSWNLAHVFMYLLFVINLRDTFRATTLKIKHTALKFFAILIIAFFCSQLAYVTMVELFYEKIISIATYHKYAPIPIVITELIDAILSIELVYMFVHRLFLLFRMHTHNKISELNWKQQSILYSVTQYTILSTIAIISSQTFLISSVNNSYSFKADNGAYYHISYTLYSILMDSDAVINSLCIFLNFRFSHLCYVSMCCFCDDCCHAICKKCAATNSKNNVNGNNIINAKFVNKCKHVSILSVSGNHGSSSIQCKSSEPFK